MTVRRLAVFLVCAWCLLGEPPARRKQIRVPVWPENGTSLEAGSVMARVNGEPARILRLKGPSDDLLLLLVLDLTGDLSEIDLARDALAATIAELPANVYIGVLRAQEGLRVLVDPTDDRDAVIEAIRNLSISGTPGLLETIETVSELADSILEKAPVRIAICYITDSDVRDYREDFTNPVINWSDRGDLSRRFPEGLIKERMSKLQAKLAPRNTPIFVVHLEYRSERLNEAYQSGLLELTAITGGTARFCRTNSEIAPAIEETLRLIAAHYSLDLLVASRGGGSAEITLESEAGPLRYRHRVFLRKK